MEDPQGRGTPDGPDERFHPSEGAMTDTTHDLLRALVSVSARAAFPESELLEMVAPAKRGRKKLVAAYNMCDGTKTQGDVVKALKLDNSNFSRAVARWARGGVIFKIRSGNQVHLLHAYPIGDAALKGTS